MVRQTCRNIFLYFRCDDTFWSFSEAFFSDDWDFDMLALWSIIVNQSLFCGYIPTRPCLVGPFCAISSNVLRHYCRNTIWPGMSDIALSVLLSRIISTFNFTCMMSTPWVFVACQTQLMTSLRSRFHNCGHIIPSYCCRPAECVRTFCAYAQFGIITMDMMKRFCWIFIVNCCMQWYSLSTSSQVHIQIKIY